jgi:hypothetical protein
MKKRKSRAGRPADPPMMMRGHPVNVYLDEHYLSLARRAGRGLGVSAGIRAALDRLGNNQ